jgi:hypothetical protein
VRQLRPPKKPSMRGWRGRRDRSPDIPEPAAVLTLVLPRERRTKPLHRHSAGRLGSFLQNFASRPARFLHVRETFAHPAHERRALAAGPSPC